MESCQRKQGFERVVGYIKGAIREGSETNLDVEELADICNERSKIDISQTWYEDLRTNVVNEDLDKEITQEEIEEAAEKLKDSKTSDGITASTVKFLLPTLMTLLIILYNMTFIGGPTAYPTNWITFVNGIPKKGKLEPPKFVRFISVMGIFEKIYQIILSSRLCKLLKIPSQQTAYQKERNCSLHVMSIRLLKILTKKTKNKLYIIFTDFEAAFDLVSRRLLFEKLIKLGVSATMLCALLSLYITSKAVVESGGQFSDYLILLAGVKQGGPPSGLVYIAYTLDLIDIYENKFHPEPLIYIYHLLMHADDILMLSTSRKIAID